MASNYEFELDGKQYRGVKLSAVKQLHLVRRILPLLSAVGAAAAPGQATSPEAARQQFQAFSTALGELSDESMDYVLTLTLTGVQRFDSVNKLWSAVWLDKANRAAFEDLEDIMTLLPLVVRIIQENLANFFNAPPTGLLPAVATADR